MKGIGLITLSTDPVGEDAFKAELSEAPVRVFTTRVAYDEADHEAGGFIPMPDWPVVVRTLPPGDLVDMIAFSCTSATIALGNETLVRQLSAARPGLRYTSPGIAAVALMRRFGIKRIALLTPYAAALHRAFTPYFAGHGIEVTAEYSLYGPMSLVSDDDVARVPLDRLQNELGTLLASAGSVNALFLSCAAFSVSKPDLARFGRALGVPVLASVHAMAWHALDLLGEDRRRDAMAEAIGLNAAVFV
ncbi:hypothetical protein [Mesorhizobium sp.]|uniref:aspartate racemase/maleate isomerase family protein n=1 Tax=Mesorhizobium sp. TaxID=1871066 RepID=UPI000FE40AD5|nr:hypothetical protein [Mesorhizobium sp.]RWN48883.1 MAG: hypothetical protein EOR98_34390 [Mesorhizobium sp.]RWN69015.1 MAG: hypothetical protein EOS01_34645 [Mesorhizobium sp.]RWN69595.1 MAG: hypothetical protein EOS02_34435 [Mesorhizobium sp.]RWN81236.1 MAG: hypothetical protein EOS04_34350 [Mesorhizobium sp.]RWO05763.1 MAG: hypothetical protein EOS15_34795 [Mesorhizobium sp.]